MGIALAKIYERTIPGAKVTVQSTQASVENFNLLQQRRGVLAFGQGDVMSDAFKGNVEAGFPSSRDRLRMIAAVYPNYLHLVALKSANIHSLADLKGKRVSVGAARSGNELNARVLAVGERLVLEEARIKGTGAGMEMPPDAILVDGAWRYRPDLPPLPRIYLRNLELPRGYDVCWDGRCRRLRMLIGADDRLLALVPCA